METKELIEKLKSNKKPFGLLSNEEKEVIANFAGYNAVQKYMFGRWEPVIGSARIFETSFTYRINPNYKPKQEQEPEFVECDVYVAQNRFHKYYRFERPVDVDTVDYDLQEAFSMVGFAGVQYKDDVNWYCTNASIVDTNNEPVAYYNNQDEEFIKIRKPVKVRFKNV